MKTFLATASLFALLAAAPVQAQTTPTQPTETKPGVTQTTPPADRPEAGNPAQRDGSPRQPPMRQRRWICLSPPPGDWRASKLIGQTIPQRRQRNDRRYQRPDRRRQRQDLVVIVGVGGFLGIGEKNVSMAFDKLSFSRDANNAVVVTASATKESLRRRPSTSSPTSARRARRPPRHGQLTHRARAEHLALISRTLQ